MKNLYWISALVVAYVYVGYPLLLEAWARSRRRFSTAVVPLTEGTEPPVSIVIAARDEAARLGARLDNLLSQDYPAGRREIVVVSDGSADETAEVLARYRGRVRALLLPKPVGKAAALNAGVEAAAHDLLVFADARQRFAPDALRRLVEPFADPRVGGASGELLIDAEPNGVPGEGASPVAEGVGLYWHYEKWLRRRESEVGSLLGATGAVYALRRAAWRPLPEGTLLDDVLAPMRAVLHGYRVVFAPDAKAYDRSAPDAATEHRRKVRTLAGNFQLLRLEPRLLVPVVNPVWLQFVSHKLGRLVVPYGLAAFLVSNVALADQGVLYAASLTLQVAFYVLAAHGAAIALTPAADRPHTSSTATSASEPEKGVGECAA